MNDIENLLKEEIKDKKQAGSGYRYKKNGRAIICLKKKLKK